MPDTDFITEEMTALHSDGTRSVVYVRIGKPFKDPGGAYTCVIEAPGRQKPLEIHGEGPMQALHLGLKIVRRHLEWFEEERNARFIDPETGEDIGWRQFWYGDSKPEGQ